MLYNILVIGISHIVAILVGMQLGYCMGRRDGYSSGMFHVENKAVVAGLATYKYVSGKGLTIVWKRHMPTNARIIRQGYFVSNN